MFSRDSSSKATRKPKSDASGSFPATTAPERTIPSIISGDLVITGDLSSAGEIQIDGRVDGDIHCASLIIGISGSVTGEVKAEKLRLHGSVNGHVTAKSVFLASTARIMGDIDHESLAVEPGAYMEGHCRRMTPPADFTSTSTPQTGPKLALSHSRPVDDEGTEKEVAAGA